jgi:hypothetical protein
MQIINNHQVLVTIGTFEHGLSLNALVNDIRDSFELDEITCQSLANTISLVKFSYVLTMLSVKYSLPDDLLELDAYINSRKESVGKLVEINVAGRRVSCYATESKILNSRLCLDDLQAPLNCNPMLYLIRRDCDRICVTKIREGIQNIFFSRQQQYSFDLSLNDYFSLVQRNFLAPTLM